MRTARNGRRRDGPPGTRGSAAGCVAKNRTIRWASQRDWGTPLCELDAAGLSRGGSRFPLHRRAPQLIPFFPGSPAATSPSRAKKEEKEKDRQTYPLICPWAYSRGSLPWSRGQTRLREFLGFAALRRSKVAGGFNPRTRIARIRTSRVATIEPFHDRMSPIQPSLRDGIPMGVPKPWVETHGYSHDVAPRRILGRVCPLSHSRNPKNVRVLAPNQAIPANGWRDRKPSRDERILAVASRAR